jgi:hypothetical protein
MKKSMLKRLEKLEAAIGKLPDAQWSALAECITDAELLAIVNEAGDPGTSRRRVSEMHDAELARLLFEDRPELLARCQARLATKGDAQ